MRQLAAALEKVLPDLSDAIRAAKSQTYQQFRDHATKWAPIVAHHGYTGMKEFWKKFNPSLPILVFCSILTTRLLL